jgi:putative heme iron utilization protein
VRGGFQKGHLFVGRSRRGVKNKPKPAHKYMEIECKKLNFMGSYGKFIEFVNENPEAFYKIFYSREDIKLIELGNQQLEFEFSCKSYPQK